MKWYNILNYFLFGKNDDGNDEVHIGQAEIRKNGKLNRLIEARCKRTDEGFVPLEYLRNFLLKRGFKEIPSLTRKEKYSNGSVVVGLIKIFCAKACEMESPAEYCNKYNDLFVSPDGKIKPCRNDKLEVDVLEAVKARNFELVVKGIKEAFELLGKNCIYERKN